MKRKKVSKKKLSNGRSTISILLIIASIILAVIYISGREPSGQGNPDYYLLKSEDDLNGKSSLQLKNFNLVTRTPTPSPSPLPTPTIGPITIPPAVTVPPLPDYNMTPMPPTTSAPPPTRPPEPPPAI